MKKLLAFGLSLLLLLSLCLGCGSRQEAAPAAPPASQVSQELPASSPAPKGKAVQQAVKGEKKAASPTAAPTATPVAVRKDGTYTDKEHVAAYLHRFKTLPGNYISKNEAQQLGWKAKGSLDKVAPGKSIGGDRYGNYERLLPAKAGRTWKECDIDYVRGNRNAKRIVYSNDGLIYYTGNHYQSFTRLY